MGGDFLNEVINIFKTDEPKDSFNKLWAKYISLMEKLSSVK